MSPSLDTTAQRDLPVYTPDEFQRIESTDGAVMARGLRIDSGLFQIIITTTSSASRKLGPATESERVLGFCGT